MPYFWHSFLKYPTSVSLETARGNYHLTQYSLFLCNWLCVDSVSCGFFQASQAFVALCLQSQLQHFSVPLNCLSHSAPTVLRNKLLFCCCLTWKPYFDFILAKMVTILKLLLKKREGIFRSMAFHGTSP